MGINSFANSDITGGQVQSQIIKRKLKEIKPSDLSGRLQLYTFNQNVNHSIFERKARLLPKKQLILKDRAPNNLEEEKVMPPNRKENSNHSIADHQEEQDIVMPLHSNLPIKANQQSISIKRYLIKPEDIENSKRRYSMQPNNDKMCLVEEQQSISDMSGINSLVREKYIYYDNPVLMLGYQKLAMLESALNLQSQLS